MVTSNMRDSVSWTFVLRIVFWIAVVLVAPRSAIPAYAQSEGSSYIAYGGAVSGTFDDDKGFDEYLFDARVGDLVTISMKTINGNLDPAVRLYLSSGQKLAYDDDGGADVNALLSEFRIPADGSYIIHALRLQKNQSGDYALRLTLSNPALLPVEPGDGASQAYAASGFLHDDNNSDDFQFDAQAGELVTISMDRISGDLNPAIRLTNSIGEELAYADDGGENKNALLDAFRVLEDGQYTIRALGVEGDKSGRYELRLIVSSPSLEESSLTYGYLVTGSLDDNSDSEEHLFQAHAGDIVTISMESIGGELDPAIWLYSSAGEKLAYDDDGGEGINALLSAFEIPADGEYTVHALRVDMGQSGEYELRLSGFRTSLAEAIPDQLTVGGRCTLADAITAANEDRAVAGCPAGDGADKIALTANITLVADLPPITSEIALAGGGFGISGDYRFRIFSVRRSGNLTIEETTLTQGKARNNGESVCNAEFPKSSTWGGAICNLGRVNIKNSVISENSADWLGGAIYSQGRLNVSNSQFSGNYAGRGGAIYMNGALAVMDSLFDGNSASEHGGAIMIGGELNVVGSKFIRNRTLVGGAIYSETGPANIVSSEFSDNSGRVVGGAIHSKDELNVAGSLFQRNSSDRAGAISFDGDAGRVDDSTFSENSPDDCEGVVCVSVSDDGESIAAPTQTETATALDTVDSDLISVGAACTLADAITAANWDRPVKGCPAGDGADTITLTADITLDAELPPIDSKITLEGSGHAISGDGQFRIFFVSDTGDLVIEGATLKNGGAREESGASRCAVDSQETNRWGGAVCNRGRLRITDSVFIGNSATDVEGERGGAIYSVGTVDVANSEFSGNLAFEGAAIFNEGELRVTGSIFDGNSGGMGGGGAIYSEGELFVTSSRYSGNSAQYGGAIAIAVGGNLNVTDSQFSENTAEGGGAILANGEVVVNSSEFNGNSAQAGGAMVIIGNVSVTDSQFSENTADVGGALYVDDGIFKVTNSVFNANSAASDGGAIYVEEGPPRGLLGPSAPSDLRLRESSFSGNSAGGSGGAIFLSPSSGSLVAKSEFSGNAAQTGGAIYSYHAPDLFATTFSDNKPDNCNEFECVSDPGGGRTGAPPDPIIVGGSCELADAIGAANWDEARGGCPAGFGADTILLSADVTLSGVLTIYSEITIEGGGYAISGDDRTRILEVSLSGELTIKNLTLRNGSVNRSSSSCDSEKEDTGGWGGAICNLGKLRIIDSEFTKNVASRVGGAIYSDGDLHVTGSVFRENTVGIAGGAIRSEGKLTVIYSEFISNSAVEGYGGAIDSNNTLQVTGNMFNNNEAEFGGAVYYAGYKDSSRGLKVTDSVFSGNFAKMYGGAIVASRGDMVVRDSNFNGNATEGKGGAIIGHIGTKIVITSSRFSDNSADEYGGAVAIELESDFKIRSSEFSGNTVGESGGALHSNGMLDVQISDFTANSAGESGGALYVGKGSAAVQQSTFSENSPEDCSGYVCVHERITASIAESPAQESTEPGVLSVGESCSLADAILASNEDRPVGGCQAGDGADTILLLTDVTLDAALPSILAEITLDGGGHTISGDDRFRIFFVAERGDLTIKNATLSNGKADIDAGAISCSAFMESSETWGGGICNRGRLSIIDSEISDNSASGSGGAIYVDDDGELSVTESLFRGNSANTAGGAIANRGVVALMKSEFRGNSADFGGAVYNQAALDVIDSQFSGNFANQYGGAIVNNDELRVNTSVFTRNSANLRGGALYLDSVNVVLLRSAFAENSPDDCSLFACVTEPTETGAAAASPAQESAASGTISVNESCKLAYAILAANEDRPVGGCQAGNGADTIRLTADIKLDGRLPWISSQITLEGNGHTINGDDRFRILFVNRSGDLTIKDVTLSNGKADKDSGAMICNVNSTYGAGWGGAICNRGLLSIVDSIISDSWASEVGGAIFVENGAELGVAGSLFYDNAAGRHGGAISVGTGGELSVTSGEFRDNAADYNGGAIMIYWRGVAHATDNQFSGNIAKSGGAIFSHGDLNVTTGRFSGNSARRGGGIANDAGEASDRGRATVTDSEFTGNSGEYDGGAIYNFERSIFSVSDSEFGGNWADRGGGAIYNNGTFGVNHSAYMDNSAVEGGAVYNEGEYSAANSEFAGNSADNLGGAIYNLAELIVTDSDFNGNSASGIGGAIFHYSGNVQLNGNSFSNNDAIDCAGVTCISVSDKGDSETAPEQEAPSAPTASAPAGPISVDESCSLADAITAANEDHAVGGCPAGNGADTIALTGDITLSAELPPIESEIMLEGGGHTISGGDKFRIFLVGESGNMIIKDATLVDGNVREGPAAMRCVEDQNASAKWGGAICNLGRLSMTDGAIRSSTAQNGGAVHSQNELVLTNMKFSGNTAAYGGAIFNWGQLDVMSSEFKDNSGYVANAQGGAIYNFEGQLNINQSNFSGNRAPVGGALFSDGELSVSNSVFGNNGADGNGGAIASEGEFSVTNSVFEGNAAFRSGGAIVATGELSVSDSVFNNNSARGGGAIASGRKLSVTGSEFSDNAAAGEGGAIFSFGELGVTDSEFSGNSADNTGGAIFQDSDNANVTDSVFSGNSPEDCVGVECVSVASSE